jgi:hypothetical protein
MDYYNSVNNFLNGTSSSKPQGLEYATVNNFNSINIPFGGSMLPSNTINRQGIPSAGTFGIQKNNLGQTILPTSITAAQNTATTKNMNDYFLNKQHYPSGVDQYPLEDYSGTSLQTPRPPTASFSKNEIYTDNLVAKDLNEKGEVSNYYTQAASQSLHVKADPLMKIFFSDDNINHLRNLVVQKVKEITADSGVAGTNEGVVIQTPNMDDFFYYMVNVFQNYKIHNGSICFVNIKNNSSLKQDISKLNTNVLQEYVSKMVSQINMYIYYYRDASQLPEQLSLPVYTSMRSNNKVLEYNTGFSSGNSIGMARYDQVGNIYSK